MELPFYEASRNGNVPLVEEILRDNSTLDVNWKNGLDNGMTALLAACECGRDAVVAILLAHPGTNVNVKDSAGQTPFEWACYSGSTLSVRLLLKDPRILVNEPAYDGRTPVRQAACNGNVDVIKWWIASGRDLNLGRPGHFPSDAIMEARNHRNVLRPHQEPQRMRKTKVATLLERFKENPVGTRFDVRMGLGLRAEIAAELFALVVFVSDGILRRPQMETPATRFFGIATQLPLELQMVLCFRAVGSAKYIIPGLVSEEAFRDLASSI